MKKKIALLLTLSFLLPSHMTNAKRTISMEEYALCGIGIITTLGGLKLIHKAKLYIDEDIDNIGAGHTLLGCKKK